jgi:hypothetical protein
MGLGLDLAVEVYKCFPKAVCRAVGTNGTTLLTVIREPLHFDINS